MRGKEQDGEQECKAKPGGKLHRTLDDRYSKLEPNFVESMQKRLEQFPKEPAGELEIKSYTKPVEPAFKLYKATTDDMLRDDTIYHATVGQHFLGDFIYSNGFFRWIDGQVLMELSNAPTMRVTIGGNVQAQRIISKVAPVYPKEAREIRLSGTVKLHVLIGTDGSVTQVQLINGHPALVQSAIDAVRQWRYKATTLNGKPVEVDTVVDVIYSLVP